MSPLKQNGITHINAKAKANILNNQLGSVFTKENKESLPDLGPSPYPELPDLEICSDGVEKLLEELNPNKAQGPDNIPSRLLKDYSKFLAKPLTLIYQASLHQGTIPDDWREGIVTPLFKKGDRSSPANYRPISLTSICCKILEHIVHSHTIKHLDNFNILNKAQHGFRKYRSTESQLITTCNEQAKALNNNEQRDSILLDFSKAFDKVPYQRLLHKLAHYGIKGNTFNWIKDFLRHRTQSVVVEGQTSTSIPVTSGVPQGSVIGPLLFLLYINDLPDFVKNSSTSLFADDSMISRNIRTEKDAQLLQDDLDRLQEWEKKWMMEFNPDKCESISVTNKKKPIRYDYKIHGKTLKNVENTKSLGLTIDRKLSWNAHIDKISKKANATRSFLQRNTKMCSRYIKEKCYKTYVRPSLEYASSVWDPHTARNINKLEGVQRRSARYVFSDYNQESSPTAMLKQLDWSSLQLRRLQAKATMMYRIVNNLIAIPMDPHLTPIQTATRGHDIRFRQPHTRVQAYKYSYFPSAIRIWNSLPQDLINKPSIDSFKSCLNKVQLAA